MAIGPCGCVWHCIIFSMAEIDKDYLRKLSIFINSRDDVKYNIADLTDTPEKFYAHIEEYMRTKEPHMCHAEIEGDKLHVIEFFTSKNAYNPRKAPVGFWDYKPYPNPPCNLPTPTKD